MNARKLETGVAWFTLGALVLYVPAETWISLPDLTDPGYVSDAIAMLLLFFGAVHSLRARPRCAVAPLCGAWGWSACLAWRSYFTRVISRERGLGIYPEDARWQEDVLVWVLLVALAVFGLTLTLAFRAARA